MIDMYMDLPTEAELGQAIMESRKSEKKDANPFDNSTFFEFWTPVTKHKDNVVSDKTGTVKPKCDFKQSDVRMDAEWEKFLKSERAKDKSAKPVTKTDNFGSVVLNSYAQDPDPKKLVGSIKALKKTTIKEMSGKVSTKVEELGVNNVVTKSMAAKPSKNGLVGIVKPKKDAEAWKQKSVASKIYGAGANKPSYESPVENKVYDSYSDTLKPSGKKFAEYETKDTLPGFKKGKTEYDGKVGTVKRKSMTSVGNKVFKNIDAMK